MDGLLANIEGIFALVLLVIIFLIIPLFAVTVPILVIIYIAKKVIRSKEIVKEERIETLQEGGIEEARILRDLTEAESRELTKLSRNFSRFKNFPWAIIPFLLVIDVFLMITLPPIIKELIDTNPLNLQESLILFFGPLVIPLQAWIIQISLRERPSYLDLRSPVFGIQGRAQKATDGKKGDQPFYYYITVRNIIFSSQFNNDEVRKIFDSIQEGDEVVVEYSPRTKHVWKIYKAEDI